MNHAISGQCACGAIRITSAKAPIAMLNCHCTDCQISSGAPFASGIVVMATDLEVSGVPSTYAVRGSSGMVTRSFCGTCGTPMLTQGEANPQFVSIRFPVLDDKATFKPMVDIYTGSAQPWVCLDEAIPHFPASPG